MKKVRRADRARSRYLNVFEKHDADFRDHKRLDELLARRARAGVILALAMTARAGCAACLALLAPGGKPYRPGR
jgi:hypothetical protein